MLRRILFACVLAASVATLTACGGGVRSALDPVAEAASKSTNAGGVKVSMKVTFSSGSQAGTITAEGAFDEDAGELTFDLSSLGPGSPQAAALGEMKMIYVKEDGHTIVYVGMPFLASMLPDGKTWLKADVERLAKLTGLDPNQLLGSSTQNPADTLALLRATGTVEKAGADVIDGTAVTLYHATVDLVKAAELKGVSQSTLDRLSAAGVSTQLPVDVWIGDDDGLVRQIRMSYDAGQNGQQGSVLLTMTMTDWGTDVSVDAPPDDQVFDATELAATFGKS